MTIQILRQPVRRRRTVRARHRVARLSSNEASQLSLADTAPCFLWTATVSDPGTGPLRWEVCINEEAAERFFAVRRQPGQSYAEAWYEARLPEDRLRCDRTAGAAIRADCDYTQEYRCRRADGEFRWLAEYVRTRPVSDGVWSVTGVSLDTTDRKRAEEELKGAEERSLRALEAARAYLWEVDAGTGAHWASSNCEAILGTRPTSYPQFLAMIHPDDRAIVDGGPATASESGTFENAFRIIRPDGTLRWIHGNGTVVRDMDGQVRRVLGVATDITERKGVEEALRAREEQLQLVVEAANLVHWSWDTENGAFRSPEAVERVFGYEPDDSPDIFAWWVDRIHPDDRDPVLESLQTFRASWDRRWSREYRFQRADGTYAWVVDYAQGVRNDAGELVRMVGAMLDVSETRSLQEQLTQAQKMEAVGRLAGGVAHDFNNMLGVINGYSDLLLAAEGLDADKRAFIREIRQAGTRAADLTRQLLTFSRKQVVAPQILDIGDVLASTHRMLRRLIGEDVELTTHVEPGSTAVLIDRGHLEQVLMNLAVNARDAMPHGGTLAFEIRRVRLSEAPAPGMKPGEFVRLAVRDTGTGIAADILPHIFEPFFTTKSREEGTGLGLATVYGIVNQSGGHISVESEPGRGTTFSIYLPQQRASAEPNDMAADVAPCTRGSGRILAVEDEPLVRKLVVQVLEQSGYMVVEAGCMSEALQRLREDRAGFDLLLTDVVMPGGSGRELAEEATRICPALAVLYVSGYTDDAVIRNGVSSAEVKLLPKPFTPASLTRAVREVLDPRA